MRPAAQAERNASEAKLRALRTQVPRRGDWTFDDSRVDWSIGVAGDLGIDRIEHWQAQERKAPGGAPHKVPLRAVLVAMSLGALEHHPYLATVYTAILFRHISAKKRRELGLPDPPDLDDTQGWTNLEQAVRRQMHRLFDVMDPSPFPKNRRLTPQEFEAATKVLDPEVIATRYDRLGWFMNRIIEASLAALPREFRRRWNGSVGVDSTPIRAYSNFARCTFTTDEHGRSKVDQIITHPADPDAGPYRRDADHRDLEKTGSNKPARKSYFAHEASLVIAGPDRRGEHDDFPYLIVAAAPLHRPGENPGGNAIVALASLAERGYQAGYLAGDRAYTAALPASFAYPARALGYELVLDYRDDQLAIKGEAHGALLVEGRFYCPATPEILIKATEHYRAKLIDEDTYQARLDRRRAHELRPNGNPDQDGHIRLMCPAAPGGTTVRCEIKPTSRTRRNAGKPAVRPQPILVANPPDICAQRTVTFAPEDFGRYYQPLRFGTPDWHDTYGLLRNAIEGGNGHLKDASGPAIGDPSRRRIRGTAAQSVFVALGIFSLNLQRINSFLTKCVVGDDGVIRTRKAENGRKSGRTTKSLNDFLPLAPSGDPPAA